MKRSSEQDQEGSWLNGTGRRLPAFSIHKSSSLSKGLSAAAAAALSTPPPLRANDDETSGGKDVHRWDGGHRQLPRDDHLGTVHPSKNSIKIAKNDPTELFLEGLRSKKEGAKPPRAAAGERLCVLCVALPSRGHLVT